MGDCGSNADASTLWCSRAYKILPDYHSLNNIEKMADTTVFVKKLVAVTISECQTYTGQKETDTALCSQIKKYWQAINQTVSNCSDRPWSAVFISYCVKEAGATSTEFLFADGHAEFVYRAIQNSTAGTGVFRGVRITEYAPKVGDIIHKNRGGNRLDFEYARTNNGYASHSAIVVEIIDGFFGKRAITIGGNEKHSIKKSKVKLDSNGFVKQKKRNPYISIIKTLK